MKEKEQNILILGLGNDILTDDGIGAKLVAKLKKDLTHPDIQFQTSIVGGLEIIELIKDFAKVIIIDGIKTANGKPGTIYHMNTGNYKETLHLSNFHDLTFLAALELAEQMEISLPEQIEIFAIEIIEDLVLKKFSLIILVMRQGFRQNRSEKTFQILVLQGIRKAGMSWNTYWISSIIFLSAMNSKVW